MWRVQMAGRREEAYIVRDERLQRQLCRHTQPAAPTFWRGFIGLIYLLAGTACIIATNIAVGMLL